MVEINAGQEPLETQVGQVLRIRLPGGQQIEGSLVRADGRTLRLRVTDRGALVVVYRQAVAAIDEVRLPERTRSMADAGTAA